MILNELFKQHSILLLLFAVLVWTIFKFPKIVKRQKANTNNSRMYFAKKHYNHSGKTRKQVLGKDNDLKVNELPLFNHPNKKECFVITKATHDRIGKHKFIPLYKSGDNIAGVILTSKSSYGKKKNFQIKGGYLGHELHHCIAKINLTKKDLRYSNNISYDESNYLQFLKANKKNLEKYNEFINKKQLSK